MARLHGVFNDALQRFWEIRRLGADRHSGLPATDDYLAMLGWQRNIDPNG